MRAPQWTLVGCVSSALVACAGTAGRPSLTRLLADAPDDVPARLLLVGDHVAAAAVPLGPGSLPAAVRTTFEAIAPGGNTTFVGREWSERGDGYRLEKSYVDGLLTKARSVLAAADGRVLERWHTVPLRDVPQQVLATALRTGPAIDEARIVSGPAREEYWSLQVRDRGGRTFVVLVGLDGAPKAQLRRLLARLDS